MTSTELLFIAGNGIITILVLFVTTTLQLRKSRADIEARVATVQTDAQHTINQHYDQLMTKADQAEQRASETALLLSDANHRLELLRLANDNANNRLTRMESEMSTTRAAADIAFEALKNANRQIEELTRRVKELEAERDAATRQINDLQSRIVELTTANRQIDELTRRVKELETERQVAQRQIADLKANINQLQLQLDAERKLAARAAQELDAERSRANDQETRLREQAVQLQAMSVQIAALQAGKGAPNVSPTVSLGSADPVDLVLPVGDLRSGGDADPG